MGEAGSTGYGVWRISGHPSDDCLIEPVGVKILQTGILA